MYLEGWALRRGAKTARASEKPRLRTGGSRTPQILFPEAGPAGDVPSEVEQGFSAEEESAAFEARAADQAGPGLVRSGRSTAPSGAGAPSPAYLVPALPPWEERDAGDEHAAELRPARSYQPKVMPGMLQTREYTTAALNGVLLEQRIESVAPEAEVEAAAAERMDRQRLSARADARWYFLGDDAGLPGRGTRGDIGHLHA